MKTPKIGITGAQTWLPNGTERIYLNQDYAGSVEKAGGLPFVLPILHTPEMIPELVSSLDGILFSGGEDINPLYFGEEPNPLLGEIHDARDRFELLLFQEAYKQKKPIFGICRGLQLITVAMGGSLWQELSRSSENCLKHSQEAGRHVATHYIDISEGSRLEAIFGKKAKVNSYHHQSAKEPGGNGIITATASDGIIEAVDWSTPDHYCHGVQWHPEGMTRTDDKMLELFKEFIGACR